MAINANDLFTRLHLFLINCAVLSVTNHVELPAAVVNALEVSDQWHETKCRILNDRDLLFELYLHSVLLQRKALIWPRFLRTFSVQKSDTTSLNTDLAQPWLNIKQKGTQRKGFVTRHFHQLLLGWPFKINFTLFAKSFQLANRSDCFY